MNGNTVSVERVIQAPASAIFAIVADAGRHSEIDGSGSVQGLKEPGEPLTLGSVFGMSMKQGVPYTTSNRVVEFEQDRLIAWKTVGLGGLIGGRIWRYELEPTGDGTRVRETWDVSEDKQRFFLKRGSMPTNTGKAMSKTLKRIAAVVEG
ncbi:SRPBCC family protein [Aeromicrobium sp. Leaf350]|uniref:SRPBCC family protein n=1 Tax=Aeromicrobium sp. Leaf350 TaxID=2876565 RepID=UPI001E2B1B13|nr:SRPBCC family protein [Aeromicrobium sp. Leaf350]